MENIEFHEGDFVQRKDGEIGYVKTVCHCIECKRRGFFEPVISYLNGEEEDISIFSVPSIPQNYIQIGKHIFNESVRKNVKKYPKYSLIGKITYKDVDPDIIAAAMSDIEKRSYIPALTKGYCDGSKTFWILKKEN